jgi:cytohesin
LFRELSTSPPRTLDAFVAAYRRADVRNVRRILEVNPALATARTPDGKMILHFGVGDPWLVRRLLELGADPNSRDTEGFIPLQYAARWAQRDAIQALIGAGSVVNVVDAEGNTPLHWAVRNGRFDIVQLLLAAGANTSASDSHGRTPLRLAQDLGKKQLFALLQ